MDKISRNFNKFVSKIKSKVSRRDTVQKAEPNLVDNVPMKRGSDLIKKASVVDTLDVTLTNEDMKPISTQNGTLGSIRVGDSDDDSLLEYLLRSSTSNETIHNKNESRELLHESIVHNCSTLNELLYKSLNDEDDLLADVIYEKIKTEIESINVLDVAKTSVKRLGGDLVEQPVQPKKVKLTRKFSIYNTKVDDKATKEISVVELDETQHNYTKALFDPDETADLNDPRWQEMKDLKSDADYFRCVRKQWKSQLPNPHKDLSRRYTSNTKKCTMRTLDAECNKRPGKTNWLQLYQVRLEELTSKKRETMRDLCRARSWAHRNYREVNMLLDEIDYYKSAIAEMEKSREELKKILPFYYEPMGVDAKHLSDSEMHVIETRDSTIQFCKEFYHK